MQVSYKQILQSFLDNYIKVHFEIRANKFGFETKSSINETGKFTISKHSRSITHWFKSETGKSFVEYKIEKDKGNILVVDKTKEKVLIKFSCKTEPLTIK